MDAGTRGLATHWRTRCAFPGDRPVGYAVRESGQFFGPAPQAGASGWRSTTRERWSLSTNSGRLKRFSSNTLAPIAAAATGVSPHARAAADGWSLSALLKQVRWSLGLFAFLVYVYVVTSYRVPLGTAAMSTALVALPLEPGRFRLSPVVAWTLALLGWAILGWGTSEYSAAVGTNLIDFAKVCAVILVAVNVVTTRTRLRLFLLVYLGAFALYPVRGALFNYFLYHGTFMGRAVWNYIYANPNDLAGFCLLQFSLVAGVLVVERQRWIRMLAKIGMVLLPLLIVLTGSRGGFIALIAFVLIAFRKYAAQLTKLAAIAVVGAIILVTVPNGIWNRLGTIRDVDQAKPTSQTEDESSTAQRLEIWKVASTIALENPVTGVGLGAYPMAHYAYAQRPEFDPIAFGRRDAHSTYLKFAAEMGVVGLAIFLGLIISTFKDAERARRAALRTHPQFATQLFYMEAGLAAYLVAAIWASWGTLVFTYLHIALIQVASRLLKDDVAAQPLPAARRAHRAPLPSHFVTPVEKTV